MINRSECENFAMALTNHDDFRNHFIISEDGTFFDDRFHRTPLTGDINYLSEAAYSTLNVS